MVQSQTIAGNGPAGFRLPPVIDDRYVQAVFGPFEGIRIQPLPGQKKRLKIRQIVIFHQLRFGVFALDGAKCRGCRKHDFDIMLRDHTPENAGIRRSHRFTFEYNRGASFQQWPVNDVGVAHNPAHIRSRPINITGIHIVDGTHGPF